MSTDLGLTRFFSVEAVANSFWIAALRD